MAKLLTTVLFFLLSTLAATGDSHDLAALDRQIAVKFPEITYRIATSIGRPDDQGLIGRNRQWGSLYSVRFQYGAGRALRHAIAIEDQSLANTARKAISVGLNSIQPDGAFPASLPAELFPNTRPGPSDQASAAAFFLSDGCTAFLIARPTESEISQIRAAMGWLHVQKGILLRRDQLAPNRLLINALAYGSCGKLLDDESVHAHSDPFLRAALDLMRPDGVFLEAGGSDTSYQSVAIMAGLEITALQIAGEQQQEMTTALQQASAWLHDRVGSDGVLDSSSNTRTCANEEFLGRAKDVDLREVFRALAYSSVVHPRRHDATTRFGAWLRTRPAPCGSVPN